MTITERRLVKYDAKEGDLIQFPNGKRKHRVIIAEDARLILADPYPDGVESHWSVSYDRLNEVGAFYTTEVVA